jgi:hypothetical protein
MADIDDLFYTVGKITMKPPLFSGDATEAESWLKDVLWIICSHPKALANDDHRCQYFLQYINPKEGAARDWAGAIKNDKLAIKDGKLETKFEEGDLAKLVQDFQETFCL